MCIYIYIYNLNVAGWVPGSKMKWRGGRENLPHTLSIVISKINLFYFLVLFNKWGVFEQIMLRFFYRIFTLCRSHFIFFKSNGRVKKKKKIARTKLKKEKLNNKKKKNSNLLSTHTPLQKNWPIAAGQIAAKAQKIAAKGPFGLLQQFYLPALRCHNSSIAAVTKNAAIDLSFSGAFGLLRRAKNRHHMRLPFSQVAF